MILRLTTFVTLLILSFGLVGIVPASADFGPDMYTNGGSTGQPSSPGSTGTGGTVNPGLTPGSSGAVTIGGQQLNGQPAGDCTGGSGTPGQTSGFVSLSCIPGFSAAASQVGGLAGFFNTLYKICIGLGAIIAVAQLMRAGIMYMGSDVVTEKSAARGLIRSTLFGLFLLLAPALILGTINPQITAKLGFDVSALTVGTSNSLPSNPFGGSPAPTTSTTDPNTGVNTQTSGTYIVTATFSSNNADANNSAMQSWVGQCANGGGTAVTSSSCSTNSTSGSGCVSASNAVAKCGGGKPGGPFVVLNTSASVFAGTNLVPTDSGATKAYVQGCQAEGGRVCLTAPLQNGDHNLCPPNTNYPAQSYLWGLINNQNAKCYQVSTTCVVSGTALAGNSCNNVGNIDVSH